MFPIFTFYETLNQNHLIINETSHQKNEWKSEMADIPEILLSIKSTHYLLAILYYYKTIKKIKKQRKSAIYLPTWRDHNL